MVSFVQVHSDLAISCTYIVKKLKVYGVCKRYIVHICTGSVMTGPPAKRPTKDPMPLHRPTPDQYAAMMAAVAQGHGTLPRHISHLNGKPKIAHMTRGGGGRKPVISWMDAPDDVYFRATEGSK